MSGGSSPGTPQFPSRPIPTVTRHVSVRPPRANAAANPFPGAPTSAGPVDLAALVTQKDELVAQLRRDKYAAVADAYGFQVRHGSASFAGDATLTVDGQPQPAAAYLLATGAEPARPLLPGLDKTAYLTSTTAMELTHLPASLIVVGASYVGMEQAQLFAGLGVPGTLIGALAPRAEPELRQVMRTAFARDGIRVLQQRASSVQSDRDGTVTVVTASGQRVSAARLLLATGRTPRPAALNLPAANIDTDQQGFISVDEQQRTSNPRVFAAGDVTGGPQYVYVAAAQGWVAAVNAFGAGEHVDYIGLPAVTFTRPPARLRRARRTRGPQRGPPLRLPNTAPGRRTPRPDQLRHSGRGEDRRQRHHRAGPRSARRRRQRRRTDARRDLRHQGADDRA